MASEHKIDHIESGGVTYPFVDQEARDSVTSLTERVTKLNTTQTEKTENEIQRAKNAEKALQDSKVDIEAGKKLSSNDFSDTYKALLDHPAAMVGATDESDGIQGDVPAPEMGDSNRYLDASGKWTIPHDTTYDNATQKTAGLMSASDKKKMDALDENGDDIVSCNTVFGDGDITQTLGNGKTKVITFNEDGSISEVITKTGTETISLHTIFNDDGSITRTSTKSGGETIQTADIYDGDYEVTPSTDAQVLETKKKIMTDNVTVESVPFSAVDNATGGTTITIGG